MRFDQRAGRQLVDVLVVCFGDMSADHVRYRDPLRRIVIATFYHMQALLGKTGTTVTLNCIVAWKN